MANRQAPPSTRYWLLLFAVHHENRHLLPARSRGYLHAAPRTSTMVMLLPGWRFSAPVRLRLTVALVLIMVLLPLHRNDYQLDLRRSVRCL